MIGQAAAAPPSSVMNRRRPTSSMGSSAEPAVPAYRALRLPRKRTGPLHQTGWPVVDLSRNKDPQQHDEEKQGWIQHHSQSVRTPALIASPLVHGAPHSLLGG